VNISEKRKLKMEEVKNEVDLELAAAQEALRRAQQRKADAEEAARLAAQAALVKNLADEQERLARLKREAEETARRWAEKRAAEETARRIEEAAKAAETRRLEAEFEARQEAVRIEAARQEKVRKVQETARQMEIDAANLEASLKVEATPKVEVLPPTLATNPLGGILFGSRAPDVAQPLSLSAEENAALQTKRDREKAVATDPTRKVHPCVDTATSRELEALLRPLLGQVNATACDRLSSVWSCGALLNAARQVAAQYRVKPMSHDSVLFAIEQLLESQQ
jgi:hypothetical protein